MSSKNKDIPEAWKNNVPARTANFWTDGKNAWSYELLVGYTDKEGNKIVYAYWGKNSRSATTSKHCSLLRKVANWAIPAPHPYNEP